jgi:cytochrome c5
MTLRTLFVISLSLASLSACGDDKATPSVEGDCAPGQSFATVADPFLDEYCRTCHGAKSAAKLGDGHDFSEQDEVFEHGDAMFENLTGGGTAMPPAGFPQPTAAAKQRFLDWLQCSGASKQ